MDRDIPIFPANIDDVFPRGEFEPMPPKSHVPESPKASRGTQAPKRRRKRPIKVEIVKTPAHGGGGWRRLAVGAGGAAIGAGATIAVDRAVRAIESGASKATERLVRRKQDNSWENAAKKVK